MSPSDECHLRKRVLRLLARQWRWVDMEFVASDLGVSVADVRQALVDCPWYDTIGGLVRLSPYGQKVAEQLYPDPGKAPPDPLADVRKLLAGCRNISTVSEAIAHSRKGR